MQKYEMEAGFSWDILMSRSQPRNLALVSPIELVIMNNVSLGSC